jgi:hypothetical protein
MPRNVIQRTKQYSVENVLKVLKPNVCAKHTHTENKVMGSRNKTCLKSKLVEIAFVKKITRNVF